ncbi:MAG: ribosome biogenesis protein ytm1 [Alyxoria varia]|nr:MAG: ribosome biogenesis protein ytm1 [Alyxoria varia]
MQNGTTSGQQVRVEFSTREPDLELPGDVGPMLLKTGTYIAQAFMIHRRQAHPDPVILNMCKSADLRRHELSHLVNSLLTTTDAPTKPTRQPLEFHINNTRLRSSVSQFLSSHPELASPETTLRVEYSRGVVPPQHAASFPHDDCIGAVDVLSARSPAGVSSSGVRAGHERILTGSRDGAVRVWDLSGNVLGSTPEAGPPDEFGCRRMREDGKVPFVDCARFLSPQRVIAGGWWGYMRVWRYSEGDSADGEDNDGQLDGDANHGPPTANSARFTPLLDLRGQIRNVTSISHDPSTSHILSSSTDGTLRLWSTDPTNPSAPTINPNTATKNNNITSSKRLKLQPPSTPSRGALLTLKPPHATLLPNGLTRTPTGLAPSIPAACFTPHDPTVAYAASEDCSLSTWDLTTGQKVHSRTPHPHVRLRTVHPLPWTGSNSVVATGSEGSTGVFVVDLRDSSARGTFEACLGGAKAKSTGLCTDPARPWLVCGASDDGCVRGWDIRGVSGGGGGGGQGGGQGSHAAAAASDYNIYHPSNEKRKIRPVFRIPRRSNPRCDEVPGFEGVGVRGVCWDEAVGIVSGGEDEVLQVDRKG